MRRNTTLLTLQGHGEMNAAHSTR